MNKNSSNKALYLASNHYENFPVASFLIPKKLRKDVAIIYWFARTADDFADEGNISSEVRLKNLNHFEERLTELLKGNCISELEFALAQTIKLRNLTHGYFYESFKSIQTGCC